MSDVATREVVGVLLSSLIMNKIVFMLIGTILMIMIDSKTTTSNPKYSIHTHMGLKLTHTNKNEQTTKPKRDSNRSNIHLTHQTNTKSHTTQSNIH